MVSTTTQDLQHNTQAAATTDTFVAFAALLRHADAPVGSCTYVCMADECAPVHLAALTVVVSCLVWFGGLLKWVTDETESEWRVEILSECIL